MSESTPSSAFPKAYDPKAWEKAALRRWEETDLANPDTCIKAGITQSEAEAFSIVLPPPNVTGTLHVGHASMLAIEDAIVRFKRMRGYRTLWLPGTDHAAIATQSKVEKILFETEGKTRHDLGREAFLRRVEQFATESHDTIVSQVKRLGSSVDWSREAYTLDAERNLAVRTAFKRMYDAGLIYRGDRIVNWDPKLQTTVSDDEIEWKEEQTPLYYLRYGPFVISTARPETKFGDKYVVMHPDDERYAAYADGQKIDLEWINGPITATVVKDSVIDREFGTGVMTITPWHDHIDFDIAERQQLDKEPIIGEDGRLLPIAGDFAGMTITEARGKIVERLKEKGLVVKTEEGYIHNVATNSRGGAVIEPQIKRQWFVDVNKDFEQGGKRVSLKTLMHEAVANKKIAILPERFEKNYFHWIDNLRDWCISRQLWYGHRIPVWYCLGCETAVVNPSIKSKWFLVRHGETELNQKRVNQGHLDIPLNATGKAQAQAAAQQLRQAEIGLILSSDLGRCRETAEAIAAVTGAPIEYDPNLRERDYGAGEGLPYEEFQERFGHPYASYDTSSGNAESPKALETRIAAAFKKHKAQHGHRNVVIVSHGATLRMLMKHIRALSFEEARTLPGVKNAEILSLDILASACQNCGSDLFEQDPDTLDTWFSSGLWTFSTLGWPSSTETATAGKSGPENDLANYHPTALLETGYDILFFWVARMILMSTALLDEVPFKTVYLHGLVRDEQGRKMSKSLGNIINPLDVAETYGADALRLALVVGSTPGNDIRIGDEKLAAMRNFVNKLWNMGRYVASAVAPEALMWERQELASLSPADTWILKKLGHVAAVVTRHFDQYQLSLAAETLRDFTWNDVADWYIESHKIEKHDVVLVAVFNTLLELWHPIMPFVTETIFATLYPNTKLPLMGQSWPSTEPSTAGAIGAPFTEVIRLVESIRNLRALYHIDPGRPLSLTLVAEEATAAPLVPVLTRLGRLAEVLITPAAAQPLESAQVLGEQFVGYIHLGDAIDIPREKKRLLAEQADSASYIERQHTKLADPNFTGHAPEKIVAAERERLAAAEAKLAALTAALTALS